MAVSCSQKREASVISLVRIEMAEEPMTEERLKEIRQLFQDDRSFHEKEGTGPSWAALYAGEELLAEVERLKRNPPVDELGELARELFSHSHRHYHAFGINCSKCKIKIAIPLTAYPKEHQAKEIACPNCKAKVAFTIPSPPYETCPASGCEGKPVLSADGKWWECSSGEDHFMWGRRDA
jgi:hypothetical protein